MNEKNGRFWGCFWVRKVDAVSSFDFFDFFFTFLKFYMPLLFSNIVQSEHYRKSVRKTSFTSDLYCSPSRTGVWRFWGRFWTGFGPFGGVKSDQKDVPRGVEGGRFLGGHLPVNAGEFEIYKNRTKMEPPALGFIFLRAWALVFCRFL